MRLVGRYGPPRPLKETTRSSMSDNWLQLIPTDPDYQPTPEAAERAREHLAALTPDADEVSAEFKESVEFFHPGANWSGVRCPRCDADLEDWWDSALDEA